MHFFGIVAAVLLALILFQWINESRSGCGCLILLFLLLAIASCASHAGV